MSTPKKPGTDLAALKARLATKKKADEGEPATEAPATGAAPAAAPSEVPFAAASPQSAAPQAFGAAPQSFAAPAASFQAAPAAARAPAPAAAPAASSDDPFAAAGPMYDPSEGVIDVGGDASSKGNTGIVVFASLGALVFGAALGWMGHKMSFTQERLSAGQEKGAKMVDEVQKVADARKTISIKLSDVQKVIAEDPKKGSEALLALLTETMDKHPKADDLFGWQLGGIHPTGIKKTFELYEEANGLRLDLGMLASFLSENGAALTAAGGPGLFAVLNGKGNDGGTLVEAVNPICDLEAKTPCADGKGDDAKGLEIRDAVGGEARVVPIGTEPGQVTLLAPKGSIYSYAVGLEPNKNAAAAYGRLVAKVGARLEAMNKAERLALTALKNYASDPDVDGSAAQPDPGE